MRTIQADIYKGWALGVSGRADTGLGLIADGLARFREEGATLNEAYYLGMHADALLHAGEPQQALDELTTAAERTTSRTYFYEAELCRLTARSHLAIGGPDAIEVDGKRIEADNFVIATGSITRPLSIPGAEHLITSDEVLSERELPDEVVFIGGGVIAMEFSHVYARAGSKVTILEMADQMLPGADAEIAAALEREFRRKGIEVLTGARFEKIAHTCPVHRSLSELVDAPIKFIWPD